MSGHFVFSAIEGSKEQGHPVHPNFVKHEIPKSRGANYFGFSKTGDSKVQGYPLHPDFAKRKIPKERAPAISEFHLPKVRETRRRDT